ncbi:abc transporter [Ceraceosorus bombacis]|uniref:Abc transporter n=1 Tax=Ceraceosorus bombacis TaxID=401625 RepID=A0A0P1BFY3_9BASI|nr:abc transporter [Ceraceosorus bombacis]
MAPITHHESAGSTSSNSSEDDAAKRQSALTMVPRRSQAADDDDHNEKAGDKGKRGSAPSSEEGHAESDKVLDEKASARQVDVTPEQFVYQPGQRNLVHIKQRERFYQFWRPRHLPPPPPASMDDAKMIPLATANIFSQMTFWWANHIMILGYQRALEATDLWKLEPQNEPDVLSDKLLESWDRRVAEAEAYNAKLVSGEIAVGWKRRTKWKIAAALGKGPKGGLAEREKLWRAPHPPAPRPKAPTGKPAPGSKPPPPPKRPQSWSGHMEPSLAWAVLDQFKARSFLAIFVKLIADAAQMTSPLLIRTIVDYSGKAYAHFQLPQAFPAPNVGVGVAYAIAIFALQIVQSIAQHAFFHQSMTMGVHARTALISAMFKRATKVGAKDRSPGRLLTMASTDVSRIDFAFQWGLLMFTSPVALGLCLGLLIWQIKESALAGFAVLVFAFPVQAVIFKRLFQTRSKSMQFTDKRGKLINELLSSIRVVKAFAQEHMFLDRIVQIRQKELQGIRELVIWRSGLMAFAFTLPTIAAIVGFLVYSALGNDVSGAGAGRTGEVFTALTLFALLRMPLMFLPLAISSTADAWAAIARLTPVFEAPFLVDRSEKDPESKFAVVLEDACFEYDEVDPNVAASVDTGKTKSSATVEPGQTQAAESDKAKPPGFIRRFFNSRNGDAPKAAPPAPITDLPQPATATTTRQRETGLALPLAPEKALEDEAAASAKPFKLENLNLRVAEGELIAIVGPVGSGKSSILQGLAGEMRQTSGRLIWGGSGSTAYSAQQPWIQAATVRENITFGLPFEEERYWEVIKMAELEADLLILPQGDLTGIGERGTTLSGGQKARVNLARAIYFDASTLLLDDPLSAVDPHVAKKLFQTILQLRAQGRTVILVTHAVHLLPQCDRIVTMLDGHVAELGTYDDLAHADGPFQRLIEEFGGEDEEEEEEHLEDEGEAIDDVGLEKSRVGRKKLIRREDMTDASGDKTKALMETEERNTGSISLKVYLAYFKAGRGEILVPAIIISLILMQGASVMNQYSINWWLSDTLGLPVGAYEGIYGALGGIQAVFTMFMGLTTGYLTYYSAAKLHNDAIERIIYAPLSKFFDVTPKGRIQNRLSKDVDTTDNILSDSFRMAATTMAQVIGSIILIAYLTPYFLIAVAGLLVFYGAGAAVYRRSARETKRIDAVLRSDLYAHYSETLGGMATVRSYGVLKRFINDHLRHMSHEARAYYFTTVNQRWLGVRLDILGSVLVFVVALLTTAGANSGLSPAQTGLALSYILTVSQSFSWMTRQIAEVENDMSSVERIHHYATAIEQEAPQVIPEANLPREWPQQGQISLCEVQLQYREGLPIVLKGVSMDIRAGEKVGIVGRTGSGKSTLLTALLRLVELHAGSITIDGVDISKIGLHEEGAEEGNKTSFNLETAIEEEGQNLSVGQRSLVSLARALVKDSKIILLDEATASVDVENDAKIQRTLAEAFHDRTMLVIAHRLRTILSLDRVAVFDAGQLAEYASPLELFDRPAGIFRSMCERANIPREDVVKASSRTSEYGL